MARRERKPLKERARGLFRNQFTCACSPGKTFRGHRALNAHHLSRHGGYWAGQKARGTGRKIGKAADGARRHARGWQEAHGLLDHRGKATPKARSRPDAPVRRIRDLRDRHRHGKDSDRTDQRAARHERHAARSDARAERATAFAARLKRTRLKAVAQRADARVPVHRARAAAHRGRVADTRMAHHQRWPERTTR
jgi:hypothetical protein